MKNFVILLAGVLLVSASVYAYSLYTKTTTMTATCTGSKNCNACKNCKYCKHCAKNGGTCGVCR